MSAETVGLPGAMGQIADSGLWYELERATHVMTAPRAVLSPTAPLRFPGTLWSAISIHGRQR